MSSSGLQLAPEERLRYQETMQTDNQTSDQDGPVFTIHAAGVDVDTVAREIEEKVRENMAAGRYADAKVGLTERANLSTLKNHDEFLAFYLSCLREAAFVDISDFEIRERRRIFAPLLLCLKKVIWSLLKFYTYRLWSQQNQVNGLLVTAIENVDKKYEQKIADLEKRLTQ